jgi:Tfp pilus assembly protein PilE
MKFLGFDDRKNKLFWEGFGLFLLILTMIIVSILHLFDIPNFENILKSVGFIFSVLFFVGIVYTLYKQYYLYDIRAKKIAAMFKIKNIIKKNEKTERWNKIKELFQSQNPSAWRMAIIDADSMLEELITSLGYNGATFGEKLKSVNRSNAPWIDDAWHVHKLRNKLAHEGSNYNLTDREVYQALRIYENLFYAFKYIK